MLDAAEPAPLPDAVVIAVLVLCNGAPWLPRVLAAVSAQTHLPDRLVIVDQGSDDSGADLVAPGLDDGPLADRFLVVRTCTAMAPGSTPGFGDGVREALKRLDGAEHPAEADETTAADPTEADETTTGRPRWLWLLHDDGAPDPGALEALLRESGTVQDLAVLGPKIREWPSLRRLLEVGVTITGTGRRVTGLEPGEPDQGQHDEARDVLAVGTAGMLVRRDVWDATGGLDPLLPLFGDDVDLGWTVNRAGHRVRVVPSAVVFHAEASTRSIRAGGPDAVGVRRLQRRAATIVLLTHAAPALLPWQVVRLLGGSLLRALGLLVAKAPAHAWAELAGTASAVASPAALMAGRRRRAQLDNRSRADLRSLRPGPLLPYRTGLDTVAELGHTLTAGPRATPAGRRVAGRDLASADLQARDLPASRGWTEQPRRHPWAATVLALVLVSLLASRAVLAGVPAGGAMLPAPDDLAAWWRLWLDPWHAVGVGSDATAAPYVAVLAVAGVLAFGQPGLLVWLLVVGAVPLAALTAHRLARTLVASRTVQTWAAVTYALLPVATGAVSQGRLGTLVGAVLAPVVARSAVRAMSPGTDDTPWWQRGLRWGLWSTLLVAFVPVAWVLLLGGAFVALGTRVVAERGPRWRRVGWREALLAVATPALLGPATWQRVLSRDGRWLEAGAADAGVGPLDPSALQLLAGVPGGPVPVPAWLLLVPAALALAAALFPGRRRTAVVATLLVAVLGLGLAVAGAGRRVEVGEPGTDAPVWVGWPLLVWAGGLVLAAALAADGRVWTSRPVPRTRGAATVARTSLVAALVAVAVAVPLAAGAAWVWHGVDGPLSTADAVLADPGGTGDSGVPAYLGQAAAGPEHTSTVVLTGSAHDGITVRMLRDDGTRLGDESVPPGTTGRDLMLQAVRGLLSEPTSPAVDRLTGFGVGAVYAPAPVDPAVAAVVDAAPGVRRAGTLDPDARAWELLAPAGATRVLSSGGDAEAAYSSELVLVLSGDDAAPRTVRVPDGPAGRVLTVAAPASSRWRAEVGGQALPAVAVTDASSGFVLPAGASQVEVSYSSNHRWAVLAQLTLLAVLLVLAAPGRRRDTP